ncbi:hypothetical protein [Caldicellulosiruptor changbaiensis]|nr:hypothetical protein [Caldicellulosiruptor changbaiensis]
MENTVIKSVPTVYLDIFTKPVVKLIPKYSLLTSTFSFKLKRKIGIVAK